MRARVAIGVVLAAISLVLYGCSGSNRATEPSGGNSVTAGGPTDDPADASQAVRRVNLMDACDPATFNAVLGPGTCVGRNGGLKFDHFIAQLTQNQKVGAWHNAPPEMTAKEGATLLALNHGGEVHTFTRVAAFGGGIIPMLNELSGNPDVAEECTELDGDDFVPPGQTYEEEVGSAETQLFMCCIHPWMRTTVHTH